MQTLRVIYQTVLVILAAGTLQAQPVLIKEIPRGSAGFSVIGDLVYFYSADSLYRTDGTAAGTIFLKKVQPRAFKEFMGILYFSATASGGGVDLWKSNGTPSGTIKLKSFSAITFIEDVGDVLFFIGFTDVTGRELHKTNGTPAGTVLVKDINPGSANGIPDYFPSRIIGNNLFFPADNGTQGIELWKSDGTGAGTQLVKDINPGLGNGFVRGAPAAFNNKFYFIGSSPEFGTEPWVSGGTAEGTMVLKDIVAGTASSSEVDFALDHAGFLYFTAAVPPDFPGEPILQLWKTDGTEEGTSFIKDLCEDCVIHSNVLVYNDRLYFFLQRDEVVFLWGTDGSADGTEEVFSRFIDGNIPFFDVVNDLILFYRTSQGNSIAFHRSDGTSTGTTELWSFTSGGPGGRTPISLAKVNDLVFFADHDGPSDFGTADDPEDAFQLMQTDGFTVVSLRTLFGISLKGTDNIVDFKGKVLFTTQDNQFGSTDARKRLWIYDLINPRKIRQASHW